MSLDCCREFDLSSGGLCSEVLQYIHQDIIKTKDLQEHFFLQFSPFIYTGKFCHTEVSRLWNFRNLISQLTTRVMSKGGWQVAI